MHPDLVGLVGLEERGFCRGFDSFRPAMLAPESQCAPADVGHTYAYREFNAVTDRDQS